MREKYINPPLNYMGGKFKLLPQLRPLMDYTKTTFFDMFAGGGAVAMNLGIYYNKVNMNDLLSIGIHRGLYNTGEDFVDTMKDSVLFKRIRELSKKYPTSEESLNIKMKKLKT